ncbi:hypothetical protein JYT16_00960 [Gemmatimonas aurantiaca]|nr:hypothetical protein [Gemmatimonas aurantiaca]
MSTKFGSSNILPFYATLAKIKRKKRMSYTSHWEPDGILCVFSGPLTDEDVRAANEEFYSDKRSLSCKYQIGDYLNVTDVDITVEVVREAARLDKIKSKEVPGIKVALITTRSVMKGLCRVYELSGGEDAWETQIFETEAEAREWIGKIATIGERVPTP